MATAHLQFQTQPGKPKRRRCREITITAASADHSLKVDSGSPGLVSPNTSANPQPPRAVGTLPSPGTSSCRDLKIHHSPAAMDYCTGAGSPTVDQFPLSFSKFNSALTAGLLSPPPQIEKTRSSPTLFEMMANDTDCAPRAKAVPQNGVVSPPIQQNSMPNSNPPPIDKQALMQQRIMDLLASRSLGDQFNNEITGDVKLNLTSGDGIGVSVSVHRQILAAHSRFFASKLNDEWVKQQNSRPIAVEIACEDIEGYFEAVGLMYSKDLKKQLMKEDVPKVLGILKVSAAIGYDIGVLACLEYLEAAPWAEDEEEKVASLLSELSLVGVGVGDVLKRVSTEGSEDGHDNEVVLLKLLRTVLEGKEEKARREMKNLLTKMLRENSLQSDLRKESLYSACDDCLTALQYHFLRAAEADLANVSQIVRQADNLHWLLDILIDRQIAEEFLKTWAAQSEMSEAHARVPAVHRYEVSRVTARLLVGVGKGQLLASKEARCQLLQTWLVPFYDDYGWMRRASKGLNRHLIEESLSSTILTLPMPWQQEILLSWFDRFLNAGDDCPNIQKAFQAWWRRAFWRRRLERHPELRIVTRIPPDNLDA